jgi:hypothetical protein
MSAGRQFPWPRPHHCPRCGSPRLWGHGYVERYFDEVVFPVWIKRYRCPECRAVHTCRPATHWRRFWAPVALILVSLRGKLSGRPWQKPPGRERQQYWWQGYRLQSHFHGLPPAPLEALLEQHLIVATHSLTDRAVTPFPEAPYRRLASTAPLIGPTLSAGG